MVVYGTLIGYLITCLILASGKALFLELPNAYPVQVVENVFSRSCGWNGCGQAPRYPLLDRRLCAVRGLGHHYPGPVAGTLHVAGGEGSAPGRRHLESDQRGHLRGRYVRCVGLLK